MSDLETLSERLAAVERAVTGGKEDHTSPEEPAALKNELDSLDQRVRSIEERVADLEAATQAVRGYVGSVRAVNEEVEARADAALAGVQAIEHRRNDENGHGSFWIEDPPVDPGAGEGWRDVAVAETSEGNDGRADSDGPDHGKVSDSGDDGSREKTAHKKGSACKETTTRKDGELRAAVRRLGEVL